MNDRRDEALRLIGDRRDRVFIEHQGGAGSIPVIAVRGPGLAEAWELSLLALWGFGSRQRTEYDKKNEAGEFVEPESVDCTMRMIVEDPLAEPAIHRCFPGGLDALEEYRQEVVDGIKDHWIRDPNDPTDQRWEYTYHERIFNYKVPGKGPGIDQIAALIDGLAKSPHSRRQQAIVWKVWEDNGIGDPACMQSLWFRVMPGDDGVWTLNLNVRFRSRDAYDAAFMNIFAIAELMRRVADGIARKAGREVRLGRYVDESDSYHIYGSKLADFQARFLKQVGTRSFDGRTWTREFAEPIFAEARPVIIEKIREQDGRK